jgi:ribonucleotide reductase alpha subunit
MDTDTETSQDILKSYMAAWKLEIRRLKMQRDRLDIEIEGWSIHLANAEKELANQR